MAKSWTLVTNHGAVWVLVAREGFITEHRIADRLGIALRTAQRILAELEEEGFLVKYKEGRTNRYEVCLDHPMRHRGLARLPVGEVLGAFLRTKQAGLSGPRALKAERARRSSAGQGETTPATRPFSLAAGRARRESRRPRGAPTPTESGARSGGGGSDARAALG